MQTKEQFINELLDKYDADDLVDILHIDAEELIERFDDKVDEALERDQDEDDNDED